MCFHMITPFEILYNASSRGDTLKPNARNIYWTYIYCMCIIFVDTLLFMLLAFL